MFGRKRCSLCGGKLDHNICTLCGLDNSKSDENYKLNVSSCDGEPMTHVHEEPSAPVLQKKKKPNPVKNSDEGIGKKIVGIIVSGIVILNVIAPLLGEAIDYFSDDFREMESVDHFEDETEAANEIIEIENATYQFTSRELLNTGLYFNENISPGTYIVGVHIPEGKYEIRGIGENTTFSISDPDNNIFVSELLQKSGDEIWNVRCYAGAVVKVYGLEGLHFSSENAQTEKMISIENPMKDAVVLEDGFVAGEDFPEGVYDIFVPADQEMNTDFSYDVPVRFPGEEEESFRTNSIWIATFKGDYCHKNLYFPKGTKITLDEETSLTVQPSEKIPENMNSFDSL